MGGKRGQFTIFVILGMMIFAIFGFAIFARTKIVDQQLKTQADKLVKEFIDQSAIQQYVTSCLDSVTEEAIIRTTMQGGITEFDDENPAQTIEYNDSIYNRYFNVSIILRDNTQAPIVQQNIPEYPLSNAYLSSLDALYRHYISPTDADVNPPSKEQENYFLKFSGFFGYNSLTRLCQWNGTNKNSDVRWCIRGTNNHPYYTSVNTPSIQKNMETFISSEITKCVNFTLIQSQSSTNITFEKPYAELTYGESDISVVLNYPVTVTFRGKPPIKSFAAFTLQKDIPMKKFYNYVISLLDKNTKSASFKISKDYFLVPYYNNYLVEIDKDVSNIDGQLVDLLQIRDNKTLILGKPLTFSVAIQNRRPALDYIHETNNDLFDITGVENETIILKPRGYDPDDDFIEYNYSGWMEDYTESFDPECTSLEDLNEVIKCSQRNQISNKPHNWSNSELFSLSKRNASYKTLIGDKGFHIVTITIKDRGKIDFQNVRILVFDLPIVKLRGSNDYFDVNDSYASVEDVYHLDGSESKVTIGKITAFKWADVLESLEVSREIRDPGDKVLTIPSDIFPGFNIGDISNLPGSSDGVVFTKVGMHQVTLTLNTTGVNNFATFSINVTQCLNHSSSDNPFPYNTGDPFMANHICCASDMTYKTGGVTGASCFSNQEYGYWDFDSYSSKYSEGEGAGGKIAFGNSNTYKIQYSGGDPSTYTSYQNDIYLRNFTRYCSGDRGNICSGDGVETRTNIRSCSDTNDNDDSAFSVERCEGPAFGDIWKKSYTEPAACTQYFAGTTFESLAKIENNDGVIGTGYCTGSTNKHQATRDFGTFGTGNYECFGQCDGGGGCTVPVECTCKADKSSSQCVGRSYSDNKKKINGCSAGEPFYKDMCDDCYAVDFDKKCYYSPDEGCTYASEKCNGLSINTAKSYDDEEKGVISGYCDNSCQFIDCEGYKTRTISGKISCYSECTDNTQCVENYICKKEPLNAKTGTCEPNNY